VGGDCVALRVSGRASSTPQWSITQCWRRSVEGLREGFFHPSMGYYPVLGEEH